ncbi:MAG: C4-type zinc ribbon domain-containing protein [Elusimicrobiales bacterium]|nr:C4-type zinc ribbon domain-containing protein [Elusimicrobiales bacterium]
MEFPTPDFKNIIYIQEIESLIKKEEDKIKKINEEIDLINLKNEKMHQKLLTNKKELQDLSIEKNKLENELITIEENIKKIQIELNQTKKIEQYNLLTSEINKLKSKKDEIENTIILKLDEIERKKREIENLSKEIEYENKNSENELRKLTLEKEKINQYLTELISQQKNIRNSISDNKILSRFDLLLKSKERIAVSQAKIIKREDNQQIIYICSTCHMKLNSNDISSLKKTNTFVVCQNCSRLLYLEGE